MSERELSIQQSLPGEGVHPVLAAWFRDKFGQPTDIQRRTWGPIVSNEHVLLGAPTGSGKTLAALLPCLNRIAYAKKNESAAGVKLLYITPLKALNNDIYDHLIGFVKELEPYGKRHEAESGDSWSRIATGVRTGDTTQSTRASMLRYPPDVLVTTPESLFILLASEKARQTLRSVEMVIVDEIHSLAEDKRGMHLTVTLERLEHLCGRPLQRIGISATINPMERVARYLGGWSGEGAEANPRPVTIVESAMAKTFDVSVTMAELKAAPGKRAEVWTAIAGKLLDMMGESRSVIVFVNNRRLCERVTLHLNDMAGADTARAHHGSISREKRLATEQALRAGSLRCLVATSSLELGIDVGHVDLVIQIDSPQSAAAGIQRIGRAGHSVGDVSRGVIVARHRGQLAECAVLAREIVARRIEPIDIPEGSIDVFCQQTAAMVAVHEWPLEQLLALYGRSDSFRPVSRERLMEAVQLLSGFFPHCRPLLEWDRETGILRGVRATSAAVLTGAGTIPQSSAYPVYHADSRVHIGELDEEYVHESRAGDVFQLGTSSYRIVSIQGDRIYAAEVAANAFSEIPFWRGDGPGRSYNLSCLVGELLGELERRTGEDTTAAGVAWLMSEYGMDEFAAQSLLGLVAAQKSASAVPHRGKIVVEHYEDDAKRHHLVIHSLFGRKTNRTWLMAMQRMLETRIADKFNAYVRDNGIEFVFSQWDDSYMRMWLDVNEHNVEELLAEAIPASPLFGITFRHLAQTSLLLARGFSRIPLWKQRLRSEKLLEESLRYADRFPLIRESLRICMNDELAPKQVRELLRSLQQGDVRIESRQAGYPSPFATQFIWEFVNTLMYESDSVSPQIQYRLITVSKELAGQFFEPAAFQALMDAEEAQAWMDGSDGGFGAVRKPSAAGTKQDEPELPSAEPETQQQQPIAERLVRLLKQQGDLTFAEARNRLGGELDLVERTVAEQAARKRIREIRFGGEKRWISADEAELYAGFPESADSVGFIVRRYVERQIAFTAEQLADRFAVGADLAAEWIRRWSEEGSIERSPFAASPDEALWTSRHAASRLLRFSIGQMRRRAEPVEAERYSSLLLELQHVSPERRLSGSEGLRQVIARLQGHYLPLSHWESFVFPARLTDYRKELLDQLCAGGEIIWLGRKEEGEKEGRIAFFLAESRELYEPFAQVGGESAEPELLAVLQRTGASFLTGLSRASGMPPSELMEKLLLLVWEGRVSNDQFAPIRLHGHSSVVRAASRKGFQSGLGRWYTVAPPAGGAPDVSAASSAIQEDKAVVAWIHHAVQAYGIVTRETVARLMPVASEQVHATIRRLEDWGMLARGFWIKGVAAMQLSTPDLVERLRQPYLANSAETVVLSAVDPANPYGAMLPWPDRAEAAFARKPGNFLVFRRGRWVMWIENNGKRFAVMERKSKLGEAEEEQLVTEAIRVMMRQSGLRKIVVTSWNGAAAAQSPAAGLFQRIGAETDRGSFVLWPSSLRNL